VNTRTRQDWILWAQLGCALVATAHAEYTLALATGLNWAVASAVPGALDLYVIRALQKHKDVLPAVFVMVAANVASILVTAGVLPLHWGLYSAVGALVPILVWRGHVLRSHSGAVKHPEVHVPDVPGADAEWLPEFLAEQVHSGAPAPAAPVPSAPALPPLPPAYLGEYIERVHAPAPVPAGSIPLSAEDAVHLPSAQAYLAECDVASTRPSVRGLKKYAGIGQDRAGRLLTYLGETS
jgi:hypothetical protein